ncbi:MAG: helix-turn-helix domain-containing protein [Theionarchaea archaeon]|nr:helix-turn-helix domain-containing protein [Theionarchaea archaeon]
MQKMIIELNPGFAFKLLPGDFFDCIEYVEGRALLKLDVEKGIKVVVLDIKVKEGKTLDDVRIPAEFYFLDILEQKDTLYTCLAKVEFKKSFQKMKDMQPWRSLLAENIIFDFPFIASEKKIVFSIISDSQTLRKMLQVFKAMKIIKSLSFHKATFSKYNVLSCLTERQKEVMLTAHKNGYYNVPRDITAEELSEKLGISKATTVEHLRKAENRIISQVAAGY